MADDELKPRFADYKFEKGEIVIVVGPYLIDAVPFPFLASVDEPPSKRNGGDMKVRTRTGWFRVTPFNKPGFDPGKKHFAVATPLQYPDEEKECRGQREHEAKERAKEKEGGKEEIPPIICPPAPVTRI